MFADFRNSGTFESGYILEKCLKTKALSDALNWQTDSPYVMFKANISFPSRINQNANIKKDEVKRMTFWEKISRKPKDYDHVCGFQEFGDFRKRVYSREMLEY
jgi:hypothetical protein